jgi:hypothetical protein
MSVFHCALTRACRHEGAPPTLPTSSSVYIRYATLLQYNIHSPWVSSRVLPRFLKVVPAFLLAFSQTNLQSKIQDQIATANPHPVLCVPTPKSSANPP